MWRMKFGNWQVLSSETFMAGDYLSILRFKLNHIKCIKTTSMENVENVGTGVLDKNKEHYLRCTDKAKKSYDVLRHYICQNTNDIMKIYCPLCQTYGPNVV